MKTEKVLSTKQRDQAEATLSSLIIQNGISYDNPFLFTRTGLLAKFLFMSEIYKEIENIPGNILEVGCWYGQTSIIFENLRAIYEPFNFTRRIVSFDTFDGYNETSGLNIASDEIEKYNVGDNWLNTLEQIQNSHKAINNSHTIFHNVAGDVTTTLPDFLKATDEPVALAYFDIATYETLKTTFSLLEERMTAGGIFVIDDYGPQYAGVSKYIMESKLNKKYKIEHAKKYKSKLVVRF